MSISIHKRPDGRIAHRVQLEVEGVRRSFGLYESREEAERVEAAQIATLDADRKGTTLGRIGEEFIAWQEGRHRGAGRYASLWRHYVQPSSLARMEVVKIRVPNVASWLKGVESTEATGTRRGQAERVPLGRPVSRQTVAHAFHLLRAFFAWAIREGKATRDPTADVRLGDGPKPLWTWLRASEIEAVLGADLTAAQRSIFTVAIYSGLRASELWTLRWNAVRLDDRPELVVATSTEEGPTKTGDIRRVPLLEPAREALRAWRALSPTIGAALVWPARDGKPHRVGFDAGWPKTAAVLGERQLAGERSRPVFHDLRHTCASHLVQGTWTPEPLDLYRVAQWLGHASIATSQRYAHLAPDGLHAAVAARGQNQHGGKR